MTVVTVVVWLGVLASTTYTALAVRRARGTAPSVPPALDGSGAAFLTGGPRRVVETALVSLCHDGRMMIGGPGIVQVRTGAHGNDPVERAVLEVFGGASGGALAPLRAAVQTHPAVREVGEALTARGLRIRPGVMSRPGTLAVVQGVACLVSLPVIVLFSVVDDGPDSPALAASLLGIAAAVALGVVTERRTTAAGRAALRNYRRTHGASGDPRAGVALHGPAGIPDGLLRRQLNRPVAGAPLRHRTDHGGSDGTDAAAAWWCAVGYESGGDSGTGSCGSSSGCGGSSGCGSGSSGGGGSSCSSGSSCGSSSSSG
ncbi:TIGR04222 domain-containing membrane protein [Streptomyces sp. NPDC048603]|uniref:TIGR04222 domain-containing membrane protein n=1 Tax=Streptomyces sp. NPDC048603 TaxID=3365577 RepID=UPI00371A8BCA